MKHKLLNKNSMKETTISEWVKPEGCDVSVVTIATSLYGSALNVVFGKYAEARKYIKEYCDYECGESEPKAMFVYCKDKTGNRTYFMVITKNEWLAEDYGTLAHELHHFTHYALDEIGMAHCKESEEAFAYFQGYFMERVVRSFIELKKIQKKK